MKTNILENWLLDVKGKKLNVEEIELEIHKAPFEISRVLLDNGNNLSEKAQILFNQWKKESEFSPKIIGYKAPFDLFNGYIKKGHLFIEWSKKHYYSAVNENVSTYSLPKEIVETWEAVYEETTEQPTETDFKSSELLYTEKDMIEYSSYSLKLALEIIETRKVPEILSPEQWKKQL